MENLKKAISDVVNKEKADIYFVKSGIDISLYKKLFSLIYNRDGKIYKNAYLILSTPGGNPHSAFKLGRMLQENYEKLFIAVPDRCKSAGTLLAIAADKIIFGPAGELGPLDVQIAKEGEIIGSRSGLDINYGIERISYSAFEMFERIMLSLIARSGGNVPFQRASKIACDLVRPFLEKTSEQISPLSLGETARAMQIGDEYAKRLDNKFKNLKNSDALNQLVSGYPDHGFVIDLAESKKIFKRVEKANDAMSVLLSLLEDRMQFPYKSEDGGSIPLVLLLNELLSPEESDNNSGNKKTRNGGSDNAKNKNNDGEQSSNEKTEGKKEGESSQ